MKRDNISRVENYRAQEQVKPVAVRIRHLTEPGLGALGCCLHLTMAGPRLLSPELKNVGFSTFLSKPMPGENDDTVDLVCKNQRGREMHECAKEIHSERIRIYFLPGQKDAFPHNTLFLMPQTHPPWRTPKALEQSREHPIPLQGRPRRLSPGSSWRGPATAAAPGAPPASSA